jgi:hypothetical protein
MGLLVGLQLAACAAINSNSCCVVPAQRVIWRDLLVVAPPPTSVLLALPHARFSTGHRDFIKNMISGAAQADVCLLMVPADGNFTTAIQKVRTHRWGLGPLCPVAGTGASLQSEVRR